MSHSNETPLTPTVYSISGACDPPSYEESESDHQRATVAASLNASSSSDRPLLTLVSIKDEQLRRFCYEYAANDCCYGSRFIDEMILTEIWNDSAFLYTLESFTEMRESSLTLEPYDGPIEDGPVDNSQPAPNLWLVPITVPSMFADNSTTTEIPHSAYITVCYSCNGRKEFACNKCNSRGKITCWRCRGRGRDDDNFSCFSCNRTGEVDCSVCHGTKSLKCTTCNGYGKLRYYMKLTVTWKCCKRDHVSNASKLPTNLVREVTGEELFKEQGDTVEPLNFPNNSALTEASARLISTLHAPLNARILTQRHSVVAVPYTRATYIWRRKKGQFYVYGFQHKVYFKEYPQPCCCCICC